MKTSTMVLSVALIALRMNGLAADYEVSVADGVTKTLTEAVSDAGGGFQGKMRIVKKGLGTLAMDNSLKTTMNGMDIREGVVATTDDNSYDAFGPRSGGFDNVVAVSNGATLRCVGTAYSVVSRVLYLTGTGAPGQGGALVCADSGGQTASLTVRLAGDATYYAAATGQNYLLNGSAVNFLGHTLTLAGVSASANYFFYSYNALTLFGTGKLVLDGVTFTARPNATNVKRDADAHIALELRNGAKFLPGAQSHAALFDGITASADSTINCGSGTESDTVALTFANWCGAPIINDRISALTITREFKLSVADVLDGHILQMSGPLTFGEGSTLVFDGNPNDLVADADGRLTIASSVAGVTGLPALAKTTANRHWTVALSADGKSLQLVYDSLKPEGSIDVVADWGLERGPDAVGNAAKFNAAIAACEGESPLLYFPAGEYIFESALVIGNRSGVTLRGDSGESRLHATEGMTAILQASGAEALTIQDLCFADCAGVAVSASETESLAVTNCWYANVAGAISGVSGAYPIYVKDGTDTYVRNNRVADATVYAAHVYHDGGTKRDGGEPIGTAKENGITIYVADGDTEDFETALTRAGLGAYPASTRLYKTGGGKLIATNLYASMMFGVDIEAGTYEISQMGDLGVDVKTIRIKDGGTLYVRREPGYMLNSRVTEVCGQGAAGYQGAIVIGPDAANANYNALSFQVMGDAQLYSESTSSLPYLFRQGMINCNRHTLTLKAAAPEGGFASEISFKTQAHGLNQGTVVVDGCTFQVPKESSGGIHDRGAESSVVLALRNGGVFKAGAGKSFFPFTGFDVAPGCAVKGMTAGIEAVVDNWIGCGTVDANVASLTIANMLTVKAADLKAGNHLSVEGALAMRPEARVTLEDAASLNTLEPGDVPPPFVFAVSVTSISAKPRRASGCDFAHWSVMDGEDGLSWVFDHSGFVLFFR